jgi:hypothetical protein
LKIAKCRKLQIVTATLELCDFAMCKFPIPNSYNPRPVNPTAQSLPLGGEISWQ